MTTSLSVAVAAQPLSGTAPLTGDQDRALAMVDGISRYLDRATSEAAARRSELWKRDTSSPAAYEQSIAPNRERLRAILGLTDGREPPHLEVVGEPGRDVLLARGAACRIYMARWSALHGVDGEGLLLIPNGPVRADVVALPDCDQTPEALAGLEPGISPDAQYARRLAENGCRVLVPCLIDRGTAFTSSSPIHKTDVPHREFIWRAAYELGRTMAGYEVQKVLAAVDWFRSDARRPVGVIGYGEGGLIALYAAAVDTRIDAALVSGYYGPRERLWTEPIYRNAFGLLREFGDAEIASLVAPRSLVVEDADQPKVEIPPNHGGQAAPGAIVTPPADAVRSEVERANRFTSGLPGGRVQLIESRTPGSDAALTSFLEALGVRTALTPSGPPPKAPRSSPDPKARLRRQYDQILDHLQRLMRVAPNRRAELWETATRRAGDAASGRAEAWREAVGPLRERFWDQVIGRLPPADMPLNPRSRLVYDTPKFKGYEVVLDVYPDVFAYGILLVPKDLKPGERRPVVVCQHGLEGRPQDVADPSVNNPSYNQFACRLAEQGFVTYAPQNPYIGGDRFRLLLRKAQPLGLTLFSFIVRQHERTLEWLASQPFVDPERIAFYGLSYGGKTAMRVPAVLERYCLSICSADYNEWIWKNVDFLSPYCYLYLNEYDMPEWNLANTFNYAEMSWLICPRPFMVERGHHDGVAPDEWVAYEYARTRRQYDLLGLGDRTEMEVFDGPHTIHGVGTFAFLHRHLRFPAQ